MHDIGVYDEQFLSQALDVSVHTLRFLHELCSVIRAHPRVDIQAEILKLHTNSQAQTDCLYDVHNSVLYIGIYTQHWNVNLSQKDFDEFFECLKSKGRKRKHSAHKVLQNVASFWFCVHSTQYKFLPRQPKIRYFNSNGTESLADVLQVQIMACLNVIPTVRHQFSLQSVNGQNAAFSQQMDTTVKLGVLFEQLQLQTVRSLDVDVAETACSDIDQLMQKSVNVQNCIRAQMPQSVDSESNGLDMLTNKQDKLTKLHQLEDVAKERLREHCVAKLHKQMKYHPLALHLNWQQELELFHKTKAYPVLRHVSKDAQICNLAANTKYVENCLRWVCTKEGALCKWRVQIYNLEKLKITSGKSAPASDKVLDCMQDSLQPNQTLYKLPRIVQHQLLCHQLHP